MANAAADQLKAADELKQSCDVQAGRQEAARATPPTVRRLHRALLAHCPGQLRRDGDSEQLRHPIVGLPILQQPVTELPACKRKLGRQEE